VLVNFVYAHQVGHAIEALHYANGYHAARPDRAVSVALNAATPTELTRWCPFVVDTYPIATELFDPAADYTEALTALPSTWDKVVSDGRLADPAQRQFFPGLAAYDDACRRYFQPTEGFGFAGHRTPDYLPGQYFRLAVPAADRAVAADRLGPGPRIAILPGGSSPRSFYPSVRSWEMIIGALLARFPDAVCCLVGKLRTDERSSTSLDRAELDRLRAVMPRSVSIVDDPILDQLATVAECDVLVAPHSGFGMAALAVGTPWLSIAGNRWPEFYFNGVPFYSVLPDITRYPCYTLFDPDPADVDDDGPRTPSMSRERLLADLEEIVEGTARLVERRWDYDTALRDHVHRMLALRGGDASLLWSVDDVHRTVLD
jgi:hypothetical protein